MQEYFNRCLKAARVISRISTTNTDLVLHSLAAEIKNHAAELLEANQKDLDRMHPDDPKYDRLKLSVSGIEEIAESIVHIAGVPSPLGAILSEKRMPNQLHISKVRVPLGVIGVIYEARPNVSLDVFALCFKTGNVCVLKGGSDAENSNIAIVKIIHAVLEAHHIDTDIVTLLPSNREATQALLHASGYVDVLIPRGSQQLINYVRENSRIPVIETGAGIVHAYFDASGDLDKGKAIVLNSKTRRVSVCNALDCLLVHQDRLSDLALLLEPLPEQNVVLCADEKAIVALQGKYPDYLLSPSIPKDYGTEFLDYKMAVKTVSDIEEALDYISLNSSRHSETIISETPENIERFLNEVDAAAVYANASTAFTDGGQFGLGAEIGISTQKLHARGPMGLEELTSYKWLVRGNGQIR